MNIHVLYNSLKKYYISVQDLNPQSAVLIKEARINYTTGFQKVVDFKQDFHLHGKVYKMKYTVCFGATEAIG